MKNNLTPKKPTSLEKNSDVVEILNWKLKSLEEENRSVEEGISDYIGFALDHLTQSIASKKFYIKELRQLIAQDQKQIEAIKVDGVLFFEQLGVEKLQGNIVSSITVSKGKPAEEKIKESFKYLVPVEEIEELLITLGKAERVTVTTTSDPTPKKLRVTQRRIKNVEIDEGGK